MSGSVTNVDNIGKTLSLSDRTKSLDSVLITDSNCSNKWTNDEVCHNFESTSFRVRDVFLPNGESYSGSLLGNIPEGSGKYVWSDGCRYEGEWRHGMRHGHGKLEWPSGAVYDGEFSIGYMHGEGMHIAPDKVIYKGRWRLNLKHGLGYQVYPNGDFLEGSWIRGTPEGPGKYKWANGNVYLGNLKGGKFSGKGTLTWINGDSYEGSWLNGTMHGVGAYNWSDGGSYIGTRTHGLKDGKGTFYPSGSRLTAGQELYLNALRKQGLLPDLRKQKRVSHISHASSVDKGDIGNKGSPRDSYDRLLKGKILKLEQSRPTNVTLERRWSLELAIEKVIGNDIDGVDTGNDMDAPILEREYMQGVLISEVVLNDGFSPLSRRAARRRQRKLVRESKRPGEAIITGHRRYHVMLSLQLGIRYSVGKITPGQRQEVGASDFGARACSRMYFPKEGSQLTPSHLSEDFKWKDYCPAVFRNLREMFKIDTTDYMMSICGNDPLRELSSPGKSGSVFFLSQDSRFMIKTLRKSEVKVLLRMLPNYHRHVKAYENTLITKFFGLHMIKPSRGQMFRFVVMGNMFCTELRIHRRFDLKGSSLGRSANKVEIDESTILKDLDLNYCFYLAPSWREALLKQIETDSKFLPGCFFCVMKEGNPSKRRASILKFFRELPSQDDDGQVLPISGLWNTAMAHPNDPEFIELGIFECMSALIWKGLKNRRWLSHDQNIYIPYYAAHIIGSYTMNMEEFADRAVRAGIIPPLVELLRGRLTWVEQRVAVRALGHLATYASTFPAVASHGEILELSIQLAMSSLEIVYSHFYQYVDRRLSYHCDLLTRGMGGVEMESRKAEEWASQLQCWSLQLINCFAFKPEFLPTICKLEFLTKLPGMWGGLVNESSPAGTGLLRTICHHKLGRGPVAACPGIIEALCNIARSSDDWQYMAIDCLLWLLQDPSTCHKVIEKAVPALVDLAEISSLGDHKKLGDSIVNVLQECIESQGTGRTQINSHVKEEVEELLNSKQRLKWEKNMPKEDLHIKQAAALVVKLEGNSLFSSGNISGAAAKYSEALALCPMRSKKERVVLHSNRAQCHLLLQQPLAAIGDATRALCLHHPVNRHAKSLWRRAQAYDMLGLAKESLLDAILFINECSQSNDPDLSLRQNKVPDYAERLVKKQMRAAWLFREATIKHGGVQCEGDAGDMCDQETDDSEWETASESEMGNEERDEIGDDICGWENEVERKDKYKKASSKEIKHGYNVQLTEDNV